ncbi:MAG: hypothetical protein OEZ04_07715 [Nitrospinota bacterium]|nr:hypothetical protein [Nitrospinota bacterium]
MTARLDASKASGRKQGVWTQARRLDANMEKLIIGAKAWACSWCGRSRFRELLKIIK